MTQPEQARQSERVIFTASFSSVTVCDHPPCGGLGPPSSSSWMAGALFISACSVGAIIAGPPTSSLNPLAPPPPPPLQQSQPASIKRCDAPQRMEAVLQM
eukprot:COSAG02_NODE_187_length_30377_cov_3.636271_13_plen_100_part_00